jgi:hypothetical protein
MMPPGAPPGKMDWRIGHSVPGHVRFIRIKIDRIIPTKTAASASMMYWMPITL